MAKPRVFVSSTYYDLRHVRDRLEQFIDMLGYEPVLFESGDIAFDPDVPLDHSCYEEMTRCHILVLVIGGRYGSAATGSKAPTSVDARERMYAHYNSITKGEYDKARSRDIPIYIFVEKGVLAEYDVFKRNRDNTSISYAHVDSVNVFRLLDEILLQPRNNLLRGFERFDDIAEWLKDQWAGLMLSFLNRRADSKVLEDMSGQLAELKEVAQTLKGYSESLIRKIDPKESAQIISDAEKLLKKERVERFANSEDWENLKEGDVKDPEKLLDLLEKSDSGNEFFTAIGFRPENVGSDGDEIAWFPRKADGVGYSTNVFSTFKRRYLPSSKSKAR